MDWFRAYSSGILRGSLSDASDEIQIIWIKFLAIESETKNRDSCLRFCEGKPYSDEYIATLCLKPVEAIHYAITVFEHDIDKKTGLPRVSRESDGSLKLNKWLIYQYEQEQEEKRRRKQGQVHTEAGSQIDEAKDLKDRMERLPDVAVVVGKQIEAKIEADKKVNKAHKKGGNFADNGNIRECICNQCSKPFKTVVEKEEVVEEVDGKVVSLTCSKCRKDGK
jgi:RNase P subunit RPR2